MTWQACSGDDGASMTGPLGTADPRSRRGAIEHPASTATRHAASRRLEVIAGLVVTGHSLSGYVESDWSW